MPEFDSEEVVTNLSPEQRTRLEAVIESKDVIAPRIAGGGVVWGVANTVGLLDVAQFIVSGIRADRQERVTDIEKAWKDA